TQCVFIPGDIDQVTEILSVEVSFGYSLAEGPSPKDTCPVYENRIDIGITKGSRVKFVGKEVADFSGFGIILEQAPSFSSYPDIFKFINCNIASVIGGRVDSRIICQNI